MRRIWAGLGMAIALAAITAGGVVITQDDGPEPGLANIWVDTNGGTCVDNATAAAYVDAQACGTFDAANDTCEGGDTVIVKGGAYADQAITGSNSRSGSYCTFTVADGETVDMGSSDDFVSGGTLEICGNYLKFNGSTSRADALDHVSSSPDVDNTGVRDGFDIFTVELSVHSSVCATPTSFVELHDMSFSSVFWTGSNNLLLEGGQVGPLNCGSNTNEDMLTFKSRPPDFITGGDPARIQEDITIDGVIFHDLVKNGCSGHMDVIQWYNGKDITIRNNQILRSGDQGFFGRCETDGCTEPGSVDNWLIENNYFSAATVTPNALVMASGGEFACTNIVVRYNTMAANRPEFRCTDAAAGADEPASEVQVYGNNFFQKDNTCTLATYEHNFYHSSGTATCGGTGENAWDGTGSVFTDLADDDFTLSSPSDAEAEGHPALCPATDFEGETRPQPSATTCDAGADEEE